MLYNPEIAHKIAQILLELEAIKLSPDQPFTWASGMKSPIYCDNRLSLSDPEGRTFIKESFAKLLKEKFEGTTAVSGVATAGIAHGALLADETGLPFSYVRAKPKGHGMQNAIEGRVNKGDKILVVEDLVSTGGSSLKAVDALREAGAEVLGLCSIFTYGFSKSVKAMEEANCTYYSLCDYPTVIKVAEEIGHLIPEQLDSLLEWYKDPESWEMAEF